MDPISAIMQLDFTSLQAIQAAISPAMTWLMLAATFLGSPVFWVGVAAVIYWRGRENESFFLMNLILFTAVIVGALKFVFARPRPTREFFKVLAYDRLGQYGFPSGHSALITGAFSHFYGIIKRKAKIGFVILIALVAFSRLYLGMHFPSDVLAGIALGLAIGKINLLARNKLFHRNFKPSKLEGEIALVAVIIAAIAAMLFVQSQPLCAALIGFYGGFFLFKEMGIKQGKITRKLGTVKILLGMAFIAAVLVGTGDIAIVKKAVPPLEEFALYLIAGFWISWAWPVLWEKIMRKRTGLASPQSD